MDMNTLMESASVTLVPVAWKVVGAAVLWLVGRWLISLALRFKVGDFVSAGGVTGTVEAIGLFGTVMNTPDNVQTLVGNNKVFSDTIQNFSANPYRRVDLTATINNAVDHRVAIRMIKERLTGIPNVLSSPAPAGLLRDQSPHSRDLLGGRVPGAGSGLCRGVDGRGTADRRRSAGLTRAAVAGSFGVGHDMS
jgi:small-conductance mechanosensitive channel